MEKQVKGIMEIVKEGKGATGHELKVALKDEIEEFNKDAQKYKEEQIVINEDKHYIHEELLDLGMMLSCEVRKYVVEIEKDLKTPYNLYIETKQVLEMTSEAIKEALNMHINQKEKNEQMKECVEELTKIVNEKNKLIEKYYDVVEYLSVESDFYHAPDDIDLITDEELEEMECKINERNEGDGKAYVQGLRKEVINGNKAIFATTYNPVEWNIEEFDEELKAEINKVIDKNRMESVL